MRTMGEEGKEGRQEGKRKAGREARGRGTVCGGPTRGRNRKGKGEERRGRGEQGEGGCREPRAKVEVGLEGGLQRPAAKKKGLLPHNSTCDQRKAPACENNRPPTPTSPPQLVSRRGGGKLRLVRIKMAERVLHRWLGDDEGCSVSLGTPPHHPPPRTPAAKQEHLRPKKCTCGRNQKR